jgi:hypothetical protein
VAARRRLPAAVLVSLALAALVAFATVAGGGERRVPVASSAAAAGLQGQHSEPALVPAKRQAAEQASFVVVAVLVALLGLAATRRSATRFHARRHAVQTPPSRAVRLRGPPALLSPS